MVLWLVWATRKLEGAGINNKSSAIETSGYNPVTQEVGHKQGIINDVVPKFKTFLVFIKYRSIEMITEIVPLPIAL